MFQDSAVYLYPEQQLAQTRIAMQWLSKGFIQGNKYTFIKFMYRLRYDYEVLLPPRY